MATFVLFDDFAERIGKGEHVLGTDTLKWALTNTAPNAATNAVLADITQISAGFGYTAGGAALSTVTYTETGGTASLAAGTTVWTASGGSIGPFRYVVAYNDTHVSDRLIGYYDHGSSITVTDGNTYTANSTSATIFTVAVP